MLRCTVLTHLSKTEWFIPPLAEGVDCWWLIAESFYGNSLQLMKLLPWSYISFQSQLTSYGRAVWGSKGQIPLSQFRTSLKGHPSSRATHGIICNCIIAQDFPYFFIGVLNSTLKWTFSIQISIFSHFSRETWKQPTFNDVTMLTFFNTSRFSSVTQWSLKMFDELNFSLETNLFALSVKNGFMDNVYLLLDPWKELFPESQSVDFLCILANSPFYIFSNQINLSADVIKSSSGH